MELLKLDDVFAPDGIRAIFHIPDYQRGYSWETKHRKDLLSDIDELTYEDRRHFAGTIVVTREVDELAGHYSVVDGQQRLTSLILLMELLLKTLEERGSADMIDIDVNAARCAFIRDHSDNDNTIYRLNPQDQFAYPWQELLKRPLGDIAPPHASKTERNLETAVLEFTEWLASKSTSELDNIYHVLTKKLGFLMWTAGNQVEVGVMFEVINNRGKPLSQLEKLKNYVLYYASRHNANDLITAVEHHWPKILRTLSGANVHTNEEEDSFLRNCWLLFRDPQPRTSHHPADRLKEVFPPHESNHAGEIIEFIKLLGQAATAYQTIDELSHRKRTPSGADRLIQRIALHPSTASILPLILAIKTLPPQDLAMEQELLDALEKLNFRYYATELAPRSDSGQKQLFQLAYDYYWGELTVRTLLSEITEFTQHNAALNFFLSELKLGDDSEYDFSWWPGSKFFLASYEEYLRESKQQLNMLPLAQMIAKEDEEHRNDFFHKEHIWAKQENSYAEDHISKRRLGNLILLRNGLNKKASNKPVEEKLDLILEKHTDTLMVRELHADWEKALEQVYEHRTNHTTNFWIETHERFCNLREQRYADFARERWMLTEESNS